MKLPKGWKYKTHIEAPTPPSVLFGYMPALCGRRLPRSYIMRISCATPKTLKELQREYFFASTVRGATCKSCKKLYQDMTRRYKETGSYLRSKSGNG